MKRLLAVILAVLILCTANATFARDYAQKFWDVSKDYWGFEYIADLAERGVIKGYEDGSFKPENIVLRSEWAKMMVTAAGLSINDNGAYFTDTNGHWANSYINTAKNYLTGYSDGSYRPDQAATREDVTVAMVKLKGYDLSDVDYSYLNTFRDVDSISNYAKGYVAVAIKNNLISGFEDNTFRGQDTLTRAEAATLMYRAFKHGNADKVTTTPTTPITSDTSKSNEDYAKQAEPKYEEPKQETKKTETKSEEPKTEITNDEPQEEEPEPVKKPYAVDTLFKAKGVCNFTDDGKSIYYTDGSEIGKADIANGDTETMATSSDFTVDNDEMTLSDFKITSICWDNTRGGLLVAGAYNEVNSASEVNNSYLYLIKDVGKIEKLTDNFQWLYVKGVLENGDFIASMSNNHYGNYFIDATEYETKDCVTYFGNIGEDGFPICTYFEKDNKIYWLGKSTYRGYCAFICYDFVRCEILWKVINGERDEDDKWKKTFYASAVVDNRVIYFKNGAIKTCNYSGKELDEISINDIEVKDRTGLSFSDADIKLIVSNDNIIFYDTSAKAFRIIKENE